MCFKTKCSADTHERQRPQTWTTDTQIFLFLGRPAGKTLPRLTAFCHLTFPLVSAEHGRPPFLQLFTTCQRDSWGRGGASTGGFAGQSASFRRRLLRARPSQEEPRPGKHSPPPLARALQMSLVTGHILSLFHYCLEATDEPKEVMTGQPAGNTTATQQTKVLQLLPRAAAPFCAFL